MSISSTGTEHYDVIIVGAGLSGIDAAYHLQTFCKNKSFVIYEGRDNIGGTWDLFKYPGIRSDSDMQTFSFGFKPWKDSKSIADADTIMTYLKEAVEEYDLEKHIRYNHFIQKAEWSTENCQWTITGKKKKSGEVFKATCHFFFICTGYYDYDEGYTPDFKGLENYKGRFVHPQKWTEDIEYENKKVVVIGSGATAVTLVPVLAEKAAHVVMLQRTPTYILSRPLEDRLSNLFHRFLPVKVAHFLGRWKNVLLQMYLYRISRKRPEMVKKYIMDQIRKVMGPDYDVDQHFNPDYAPWDQRLCAVPDNDLFLSIKGGKSSVITHHIDTFTEKGIRLKSGEELEADLIVSATGLKIKVSGGIEFIVDGKKMENRNLISYKGIMLKDIPNAAAVTGYTNASWTLKADLVCEYVTRLLNHMDKNGKKMCTPRTKDENMKTEPVIDFSSGYILRALDQLPKQGSEFPWKLHQNYIKDMFILRYRNLEDGFLVFE